MSDEFAKDWPEVFREVTPLPGGLGDLQVRIDSERGRRIGRLRWLVPVAATIALALWLLQPRGAVDAPAASTRYILAGSSALPHPSAIALGVADPSPHRSDDVVFIWVDATSSRPQPIYVDAVDVASIDPLDLAVTAPVGPSGL